MEVDTRVSNTDGRAVTGLRVVVGLTVDSDCKDGWRDRDVLVDIVKEARFVGELSRAVAVRAILGERCEAPLVVPLAGTLVGLPARGDGVPTLLLARVEDARETPALEVRRCPGGLAIATLQRYEEIDQDSAINQTHGRSMDRHRLSRNDLYLTRAYEHSTVWLAVEIFDTLHRAIIFTVWFEELDTYPFALRERSSSAEPNDSTTGRNIDRCTKWRVHRVIPNMITRLLQS